jgi:hypothetical protein
VRLTINWICLYAPLGAPAPISLTSASEVFLTLLNQNYITCYESYGSPAIFVPPGEKLVFTSNSSGNLHATSGALAAAIGGSLTSKDAGTIIINGGNIIATGVDGGAGIGGGGNITHATGGSGGTITINGGSVIAHAVCNGAGIGGGAGLVGGASGNITINGGNVYAHAGANGAGIGGGEGNGQRGGDAQNITINGGVVYAVSDIMGAGIGGGDSHGDRGGNGGNITINGGSVTALSSIGALYGGGAGIGGGNSYQGVGGSGGSITINGGSVTAAGGGPLGVGLGSAGGTGGVGAAGTLIISAPSAAVAVSYISNMTVALSAGLLFDGLLGTIVGDVSPTDDFTFPIGSTLTIEQGQSLTVPHGVLCTNNGTLTINGELTVNGALLNNGTIIDNRPKPTEPTNPSNPSGGGNNNGGTVIDPPVDPPEIGNGGSAKAKEKISAEWIWIPVVLGTLIVLLLCLMFEYHRRKKAYGSVDTDEDSAS